MKSAQIAPIVINEIDEMIYVSNIETYELIYMNRTARELLGCTQESQWLGQPCYKVVRGRDTPCDFCTNERLLKEGDCTWEQYYEKLGRHLYLKDKLIELDGENVRLEMAVDTTKMQRVSNELKRKLLAEETLIQCVSTLHQGENSATAINQLLSIIADYHQAGRSYIFEIDYEKNIVRNTYEWCREGVEPQIAYLKEVPLSVIDRWMEQFESQGEFYITSLDEAMEYNSAEYEILEKQRIESLLAAPLRVDGQITGFLGVDNPKQNTDTLVLLQSVATFVVDDIQKRKILERLYELSYQDRLTGVGNRHAYMEYLEALEKKPKQSLGIVFADINGLKIANDSYGHEYGDKMIKSAARILKNIFQEYVFRIGGDEFVAFSIGITREEFARLTERLRQICGQSRNTTISLGTIWLEENRNVEEHVIQADKLMYVDKQVYYDKCLKEREEQEENAAIKLQRMLKRQQISPDQIQVRLPDNIPKEETREALVRELQGMGFVVEDFK
ncbi:MAG: sensor domain-containing diguanylate cyclase [Lachnospiraceae bacterium]|nr:sensor domain-containing diguanylate cyclase [Lachnospiraceae bacterium]